jgi:exonuclease SbcC
MKIKKLRLDNFMTYSNQEFDLERLIQAPTLIVGKYVGGGPGESNGAGKSTIFEGIIWSLFGVSRYKSDDELIRQGSDDMIVTNIFEIDGVAYEVVRTKKRGKSQTLQFSDLTNDKKLRENSVKATQDKIISVLGMDFDIFSNTVYSPQNKLALFPSQLPSRRKEVLSSILDIDNYVEIEEQAKRMASNYQRDSEALHLAIIRIEAELGQEKVDPAEIDTLAFDIKTLETQHANTNFTLDEALKEVEELRSRSMVYSRVSQDLAREKQTVERLAGQRTYTESSRVQQLQAVDADAQRLVAQVAREPQVRSVIADVESKIKTYDQVAQRLSAMREERSGLSVNRDGLRREAETMGNDLERLRNRLGQVQALGPKCPTCYSSLTVDVQANITKDIIAEGTEKRVAYDAKCAEIFAVEARVQQIETDTRGLSGDVAAQAELQRDLTKFQNELSQIEMAKQQSTGVTDRRNQVEAMFAQRIQEIDAEVSAAQGRTASLTAELGSLTYNAADVERANQKAATIRAELSRIAGEKAQRDQRLGALRSRKDAFDRKSAQLDADRLRHKEAKDQEFVYKELTRAFGKNGIPALIMDNALAEIQIEINTIMENLTGGRITVEFATQKELTSGKKAETLDIIVSDQMGSRDFAGYSGGEAARVALAIRLALAKVISRRAGKRIGLVMIDEISDLDTAGADSFAQTINGISKDYSQIMVVTHLPHLKDQFPNILTIVKDRDGSHIETEAVAS